MHWYTVFHSGYTWLVSGQAIIHNVSVNILSCESLTSIFAGKCIQAGQLPVKSNKVLSAGFKCAPSQTGARPHGEVSDLAPEHLFRVS